MLLPPAEHQLSSQRFHSLSCVLTRGDLYKKGTEARSQKPKVRMESAGFWILTPDF
jgi:hypothetical protein